MAHSVTTLRNFFSTPERPVSAKEMMEFWKSLSDEDKAYYQNANI